MKLFGLEHLITFFVAVSRIEREPREPATEGGPTLRDELHHHHVQHVPRGQHHALVSVSRATRDLQRPGVQVAVAATQRLQSVRPGGRHARVRLARPQLLLVGPI